jgi:hypothetical protein
MTIASDPYVGSECKFQKSILIANGFYFSTMFDRKKSHSML